MKLFTIVAIAGAFAGGMHAEALSYNANLLGGVYFGSGNQNGAFTVSNGNSSVTPLEIGLRASKRTVGAITPTGNLYLADTGTQTVNGGNPARAAWNYDFSVDLTGSGLNLSQVQSILSITSAASGSNAPFNLQTTIGDNAVPSPNLNLRFQNSENMMFGGFYAPTGYNVNANEDYTFTLDVYKIGLGTNPNTLIGTDTMVVRTGTGAEAPEPATFGLIGLGLAGVYAARRRRKA
jgi:hypothetical protein